MTDLSHNLIRLAEVKCVNMRIAHIVFAAVFVSTIFWIFAVPRHSDEDGMNYLSAARHILAGDGVITDGPQVNDLPYTGTRPMVHWQPLYSAVVAAALPFADHEKDAALLANSVLLGLLTLAICAVVGLRRRVALCVPFVVLYLLWGRYELQLSEALFYPVMVAGMMAVERYGARGGLGRLVAASFLFAAMFMTRYVGAAFVLAAGIFLICGSATIRRGVAKSIAFGSLVAIPCALWVVRNAIVAHNATNRALDVDFGYVTIPLVFAVMLAVVLIAASARCPDCLSKLMMLSAGVYLMALATSIACFDHATQPGSRMFQPAYILIVLSIVRLAARPVADRVCRDAPVRIRGVV